MPAGSDYYLKKKAKLTEAFDDTPIQVRAWARRT
jgi:hypothetical protein